MKDFIITTLFMVIGAVLFVLGLMGLLAYDGITQAYAVMAMFGGMMSFALANTDRKEEENGGEE